MTSNPDIEARRAEMRRKLAQLAPRDAAGASTADVERWNATQRPYPRDAYVHDLFAEIARAQPDAIAVESARDRYTYAALDAAANAVAARLVDNGAQPGDHVAIFSERSAETVIAMLGVLKAGGAYVPLDPAYPQARLEFMLTDAAARLILSPRTLSSRVDALLRMRGSKHGPPVTAISIDAAPADGSAFTANVALPHDSGASPAYVIYTSGSTGQPKGVVVPHRGIVRLVRNVTYASLDTTTVMLGVSATSFDASTFEVWGALLNGGRLVILPAGPVDLDTLGAFVEEKQINTMFLTTALFRQVVDHGMTRYRNVRQWLTGGEVMSAPHARRAASSLPDCAIINCYGPTENTTFTTTFRVDAAAAGASIPIGRPVDNTRVYVLDGEGRLCNPGTSGELYAAGDGIAIGYFNQPALTAERFVPDPFAGAGRMYRTGDRVRWTADGLVEFEGRVDTQVKVRGFRVEPGEIETVLAAHPDVRACAVVPRPDSTGALELVAFCETTADTDALRAHLRSALPDYMVPGRIARIDSLPLGPAGKIDREALNTFALPADSDEYHPPVTDTERTLAAIWKDVIGVDRVSIHSRFFDIGGHSLMAMRIMSRVQESFGIRLPLNVVFDAPTVAQMSAAIEAARASGPAEPSISRMPRQARPAPRRPGSDPAPS